MNFYTATTTTMMMTSMMTMTGELSRSPADVLLEDLS